MISSTFENAALCEMRGRRVDNQLPSVVQKHAENLVFIVLGPVSQSRITFKLLFSHLRNLDLL